MCGARRRQPCIGQRGNAEFAEYMLFETGFGLRSIKKHVSDLCVGPEKGGKIIGDLAITVNTRVEAAFACTGLQHIPYCDSCAFDMRDAFVIGETRIHVQQLRHDAPEAVLGMRIGLMYCQRSTSGHGA